MICPYCGKQVDDNLNFCSECGGSLKTQPQPQVAPVQPQMQPQPQYQQPQPQNFAPQYNGDDYAKSALKFGITGTCFDITVVLSFIGLILGIVGIKKASNASRMGVKTGKQKAGLIMSIISLSLSVIIPFAFFASCRSKTSSPLKSPTSVLAEDPELEAQVLGTYIGNNDSVLIIREDHTCIYFYEGFGVSTNDWKIEDGQIKMYLSNVLSSVYATIDKNKPNELYLESKSALWDNETFVKKSSDTTGLDEKGCLELLGKSTKQEKAAADISASSSTSSASSSSSSGSTKTIKGMSVREALDKYEEYMDRYIKLYSGMLDGSVDYFETLTEVTELQSEMDELESALNTITESDLSPEDYKYYMEVMTRVSQKALDILG